jgi:hypothetical protein
MKVVRKFTCSLTGDKINIVEVDGKEIAVMDGQTFTEAKDIPGFEGTQDSLDNLSIFK